MPKTNAAGLALIKQFEGLALHAYQDIARRWSIGYGHTGDVKPGDEITEHMADVILESDLERFETEVDELAPGANPNEFAAMVSFAYNLGGAALKRSHLLQQWQWGNKPAAAAEFMKWVYAAGHMAPGLVRRRAAERELFLTPEGR
jgi:lysozyme